MSEQDSITRVSIQAGKGFVALGPMMLALQIEQPSYLKDVSLNDMEMFALIDAAKFYWYCKGRLDAADDELILEMWNLYFFERGGLGERYPHELNSCIPQHVEVAAREIIRGDKEHA